MINSPEYLAQYHGHYMLEGDPTEYSFALRYFGTWAKWEEITETEWFKPIIAQWRRELEAKIKSESLSRIIETSKGETRDSLQANKFLLDSPWLKEEPKRGRPTKSDILYETKKQVDSQQRIDEDYSKLIGGTDD